MKHGIVPHAAKPVAIMVAAASLLTAPARADEPQGSITVSRMLPPRDAIRHEGAGYATRVATAREDVIVAGTQSTQTTIAALPDLALESVAVGATARVPAYGALVRDATGANGGALDRINARSDSPLAGAGAPTVQAGIGGGLRALPTLGNVLSAALHPGAQK